MPPPREVVEIDAERLSEVIDAVMAVRTAAYRQWNGPRTEEQEREEGRSWLRKLAQTRRPAAFIAREADEVVGYVWGHERNEGEFYVSHIGVAPGRQRQGIGRALLREVEGLCRAREYRALSTSTYNRFRGMLILLLDEGFQIEGVTFPHQASEPRLLLRKELS